jgi:hypothetical protein
MEKAKYQVLGAPSLVKRSVFGTGRNAVTVTVNGGMSKFTCQSKLGGDVVLPPNGFLIEAPSFEAFCALSWNGIRYSRPVMFAVRSTDRKPLSDKKGTCRVFHAFGDSRIKIGKKMNTIKKEAVISR